MINEQMNLVIEATLQDLDLAFKTNNTNARHYFEAKLDGMKYLLRAMGINFNYRRDHSGTSTYTLEIR